MSPDPAGDEDDVQTSTVPADLSPSLPSADDEKVLVEPACGAALAAVYSGVIRRLQGEGKLAAAECLGPVVVVVCGGNNISMEQLRRLKKQLGIGV